jgi:ribokinase
MDPRVIVLGDLVADVSLRIAHMPIAARSHHTLKHIEVGPGGACNVAIMAARFGLATGALGELGGDPFGTLVLQGLQREGVDTSGVLLNDNAATPVAGVVVDDEGEPTYLGFRGHLTCQTLPENWRGRIQSAKAVFSDGWIEYPEAANLILEAFRAAKRAGVPVLFDPGPGNPGVENNWQWEAAGLATVVLANEAETRRLAGIQDATAAARALVAHGSQIAVVKRGAAGCLLLTDREAVASPGLPVPLQDATGAGDSVAGAMIYGYLKGLSLGELGMLANATGAAKVQKLGTGHNMPTLPEIRAVMEHYGGNPAILPP